jgi:plastocyanin
MQRLLVNANVDQPSRPRSRSLRIAVSSAILLAAVTALLTATKSVLPTAEASYIPQVREFTLTASEFDWEIQPGTVVKAWGYNGQAPGPEIRVREGDTVRVTLINHLPVATTIHWHGVMVPPAMDGPAGLNQAPVEPGQTFTYEFTATPAGTRMYHSHTDVVNQVALGLYGAFIVEPAKKARHYDQEYTYTLAEWDMELTPEIAEGKTPRGPRDAQLRGGELGADLFLMNGHTNEAINPIKVETGDRVLIRLINMGSMAHPIHMHGHLFKIVATDGNPVPKAAQLTKDTVLIGPGERYDLEMVANNPGVWMLHCHIESHAANGMMTLIEYDGATPTGPLSQVWDADHGTDDAMGSMHAGHEGTTTTPESAASATATPIAGTPSSTVTTSADGTHVTVELLDDRFQPTTLTIAAGTTVTFVNKGANWHNVSAVDGSFTSALIAPGDSFTYTFTTPGDYRYLCRQHARHGMIGTITVTQPKGGR